MKTLFDPCPAGWRVPKGGEGNLSPWSTFTVANGPWNGSGVHPAGGHTWNSTVSFTTAAWYPALGYREGGSGVTREVGGNGYYWLSSTVSNIYGFSFCFSYAWLYPSHADSRVYGFTVRCLRE